MPRRKFRTVEEYIDSFPVIVQDLLQQLRRAIREAAPKAEEGIGYNIPMFRQEGYLVYFAGFRDHTSLFPTISGIKAFEKELKPYLTTKTKGTVQFPLNKKIPIALVKRIVRFRVKENHARTEKKRKLARTR